MTVRAEPRLICLLRETSVRYFVAEAIRTEAKRVRGNVAVFRREGKAGCVKLAEALATSLDQVVREVEGVA